MTEPRHKIQTNKTMNNDKGMKKLKMIIAMLGCLLCGLAAQGQELVVRSLVLDSGDLSAQYIKRVDGNGQLCALLKVTTMVQNPKFYGNLVGNVEKREGYYWVYMTAENPESRFVEMSSDNYLTLRVTFDDYGVRALSGGCTYKLTLAEKRYTTTVWEETKLEDGHPVEQPRPVMSTALTPRWSASVTADQRAVLEKLISNMVRVEGGTFTMGATAEQGRDADNNEKPAHKVTLSDYYIGKYEVTQAEWEAVMGERPTSDGDKWTSEYGLGGNYPAYYISWNDCRAFIRKLNELTGLQFKLPTEAQWEYAARGGKSSRGYKYSGGEKVGKVAWYDGNGIHTVGKKQANELGLYDMSGNVYEWCIDCMRTYTSDAQNNPIGPMNDYNRVVRGGCWYIDDTKCRVAYRGQDLKTTRNPMVGMRLAI